MHADDQLEFAIADLRSSAFICGSSCIFSSASTSCTSARRNGSTSVTRPTVWKLPRSLSLMTVEGLMSTQTTLTQAGSRLPTATECSVVAIIRQNVTSRIFGPHLALGFEHVGDHVGQRAVVANAAGQQEIDVVLHALVHDAGGEHALLRPPARIEPQRRMRLIARR